MKNEDNDELTRELEALVLEREVTRRRYQLALAQSTEKETRLNQRIRRALRQQLAEARRDYISAEVNPYQQGGIVRITNRLRDEYGTIGTVISSAPRLVTIKNSRTKNTYTRAWWNLEIVIRSTPRLVTIKNSRTKKTYTRAW